MSDIHSEMRVWRKHLASCREEVEDDSEYTRLAIKEDSEMLTRCLDDEKLWAKWDSIDAE